MIRLTIALLAFIPCLVAAYSMSGRVIRVDKGDTVTIVDANNVQHTVRLQDIRAPGLSRPAGVKSQDHLQALVAGRHVVIDYDPRAGYHLPTGRIYMGETDINLKQIRDGMAQYQPSAIPADERIREQYQGAQDQAMAEKRGIWYTPDHWTRSPYDDYERRMVAPDKRIKDVQGDYPPLSNKPRLHYPAGPVRDSRARDSAGALYAPLSNRARAPYGRWVPGPRAPGSALSERRPAGPRGPAVVPPAPYWAHPP